MRHPMGRAALGLVAAIAIACTSDPVSGPIIPVSAVSIQGAPPGGVFLIGYPRQLTATILDPFGTALSERELSWRSSARAVAVVDDEGIVTAVALGVSTITARSEGVAASVTAVVREGVEVPAVGAPATGSLLGGLIELSVPVGAAAPGFPIFVGSATGWPADDRLVAGTVVAVGPAATELALPITAGIAFDPSGIPAVERPALRLFAVGAGGAWEELPDGLVDVDDARVSASLSRLTTIGVFRRAVPTQLVKVAGDDQVVPRGTAVPIAPSVVVRDAAGRPVSGIDVTFATGAGGGQLTGTGVVASDLTGTATVPGQWRVGSTAGTYTLVASIPGGISVTFTATATP